MTSQSLLDYTQVFSMWGLLIPVVSMRVCSGNKLTYILLYSCFFRCKLGRELIQQTLYFNFRILPLISIVFPFIVCLAFPLLHPYFFFLTYFPLCLSFRTYLDVINFPFRPTSPLFLPFRTFPFFTCFVSYCDLYFLTLSLLLWLYFALTTSVFQNIL